MTPNKRIYYAHTRKDRQIPDNPLAFLLLAVIQRAQEDAKGNIGRAVRKGDGAKIPERARAFFKSKRYQHWVDYITYTVPDAEQQLRDLAQVDWENT